MKCCIGGIGYCADETVLLRGKWGAGGLGGVDVEGGDGDGDGAEEGEVDVEAGGGAGGVVDDGAAEASEGAADYADGLAGDVVVGEGKLFVGGAEHELELA